MKGLLILGLSLVLVACQLTTQPLSAPPLPSWQPSTGVTSPHSVGAIIDLASGELLTAEALVQQLAKVPRVLIGEKHDNLAQHQAQLWLLQAVAEQRPTGSVVLEMLHQEQQPLVTAVQQRLAQGKQVADLAQALQWRGWDWEQYAELIHYLVAQPAPIKAANFSREQLLAIYQQPPLLAGVHSNAAEVQQQLQQQIAQAHCQQLPRGQLPKMLAVQQQRDRLMAEVSLAAATPSLLLAGSYHVRKDLGVPLHLKDLAPAAAEPTQLKVLILVEQGAAPLSLQQADYLWITPAAPAQDYCAQLKKPGKQ